MIFTADHEGIGKKRGGGTMAEIEIQWIAQGSWIARGRAIQVPVSTYDTAATIASVLGLRPPAVWIGKPVAQAFAVAPAQ